MSESHAFFYECFKGFQAVNGTLHKKKEKGKVSTEIFY